MSIRMLPSVGLVFIGGSGLLVIAPPLPSPRPTAAHMLPLHCATGCCDAVSHRSPVGSAANAGAQTGRQ